jgi:hypothetical protein
VQRVCAGQAEHKAPKNQQPGRLSMLESMRSLLQTDTRLENDRIRRRAVFQKWEYGEIKTKRTVCEGDVRVRDMLRALKFLDTHMFRRSRQQKMMHRAMLILSLEQYYGAEVQEHLVRLLFKYRISELRTEGLFTAPRRNGKTVTVSMFSACEVVTQPGDSRNELGHDILIYSNNGRASSLLLMHIYRMAKKLTADEQFGGRIVQLNKRESMTVLTKHGFTNMVSAYPANEEKLRGTGSKAKTSTVIGEEIGFMPVDIVFKILAPILTRNMTKFVGITTINTADSFLMPLAEAKFPDGRPIMLSLNFDLVCDDCKKRGRALQCKCLLSDIPHWQSSLRHEKIQYLMKGNMATYLTEIKNVPIDERMSPAFSRQAVDWLETNEAIYPNANVYSETVFTTIDPACGGMTSSFAIVSAILHQGAFIVSHSAISAVRILSMYGMSVLCRRSWASDSSAWQSANILRCGTAQCVGRRVKQTGRPSGFSRASMIRSIGNIAMHSKKNSSVVSMSAAVSKRAVLSPQTRRSSFLCSRSLRASADFWFASPPCVVRWSSWFCWRPISARSSPNHMKSCRSEPSWHKPT